MEVGRPKKYETQDQLSKKIDDYFNMCDKTIMSDKTLITKPYTISGLCLYLDICRDTLCEYEKQAEFSDTIKKAKQRVESYIEEHSLTGELNPTVCIFNLKNNFGWKDRTEVDNNVNANINITEDDKKLLNNLTERLK